MGVIVPAREDRPGADVAGQRRKPVPGGPRRRTALRRAAVRDVQEADARRRNAKDRSRLKRFALAKPPQQVGTVRLGPSVRPGAVRHHDDVDGLAEPGRLGDQPAAPQALVIGVRRDDERWPALQHIAEASLRQHPNPREGRRGQARPVPDAPDQALPPSHPTPLMDQCALSSLMASLKTECPKDARMHP